MYFQFKHEKGRLREKIVNVVYNGSVKHTAGERHARFIKGEERQAMAKMFHKGPDKPSTVYQERKADLPSGALASGNRTGCGTQPTTIRKIASEGRQLSQMDKNVFKSLQKIRLHLTEKESSRDFPPNSIEGFVHMICQFPLTVHMWTEDQVRLWHERCGDDISYIDATGTIIANHNGKRVLYYALVVRHPCKGNPSVPVAEMITTDQRACNIRTFLDNFRQDESKTFSGRITSPRQLNCDYSRAILLAVLREFNNENLSNFFERAFRILNMNGLQKDFTLTIPHIGCSHFMHIVHRKIKAIGRAQRHFKNDENPPNELTRDVWYRFNMYCMSLLVNARTLQEFLEILEDITICLLSKKQTKMLLLAYNRVNNRVNNMNNVQRVDLCDFETDSNNIEQEKNETAKLKLNVHPFNAFFKTQLSVIEQRVADDDIKNEAKDNRSYCPTFMHFIKSYLPEMALWSGVLLGSLERYKENSKQKQQSSITSQPFLSFSSANSKTEGYIEGAMRNLKQEDFPGRKHLRPDDFVLENYRRIRRRIIDFSDRLHTSKKPRMKRPYTKKKKEADPLSPVHSDESSEKKDQNYHNVEETWGKKEPETPKENPRLGQFQQSPKIPLSQEPDLKKKVSRKRGGKASESKLNSPNKKIKTKATEREHVKSYTAPRIPTKATNHTRFKKSQKIGKKTNNQRKNQRLSNSKCRENRKRLTEWIYNFEDDEESGEERSSKRKLESCFEHLMNSKFMKSEYDTFTSLNNINFIGLQNKRNDCWLNSLVQCISYLPVKKNLLDSVKQVHGSPITRALTDVLSKMDSLGTGCFYPKQLHIAFQKELQYAAGEQNDIHESFTSLCCPRDIMNGAIASHFQGGIQYRKTCSNCLKHEDGIPETFTSLPLSVFGEISDVENSIANVLNENISICCSVCQIETIHIRQGQFLFLPNTLALLFKRFSHAEGVEHKNHSIVDLQKQMVVLGNTPCYYTLKACALHHGYHINSGHYTALIFDENTVLEIDDERARDRSDNWKSHAGSTVYLAFYNKSNLPIDSADIVSDEDSDKQSKGNGRNKEINEKRDLKVIESLWDVTEQNSVLCCGNEFGYELKGSDFKTLEFPVVNNSYKVKNPGWLNDNIVDAYISLLVKTAANRNLRVNALNCFFMRKLRELLKRRSASKLYEMISKFHKKVEFETLDYIIVPINTNNSQHWTVIFIDVWMARIYHYDPMLAGARKETDVKLIKFYFEQFFKCHSYDVEIQQKRFVTDFHVIWEEQFACQNDYSSCGVYVLMYLSHKLYLLNHDPVKVNIADVRKEMAEELHRGKKVVPTSLLNDSITVEKKCLSPSRYRQHFGNKVVLHCQSSESGTTFTWTFQGVAVSSNQIFRFILSKEKVGDYFCYIRYNDGKVLKSHCKVECATTQSEKPLDERNKLDTLEIAMEWNFTCIV